MKSSVPSIVLARQPSYELPQNLEGWAVANLPTIMRNTQSITNTAFSDYKKSSVLGINPVGIMLANMQDDNLKLGLVKALELIASEKEKKFVILTCENR